MSASFLAKIARPNQPDAAKVEVEKINGRLGDFFELVFQRIRQKQVGLQLADARQAAERIRPPLLDLFLLGDVAHRG